MRTYFISLNSFFQKFSFCIHMKNRGGGYNLCNLKVILTLI